MPKMRNSIRFLLLYSILFALLGCRFAGICIDTAEKCAQEEADLNNASTATGSCGSSSMHGVWVRSDTLIFKNDCTFTSSNYPVCGPLNGSIISNDSTATFTMTVSTVTNDAPNCRTGSYNCTNSFVGTDSSRVLTISCTLSGQSDVLNWTSYNFQPGDPN